MRMSSTCVYTPLKGPARPQTEAGKGGRWGDDCHGSGPTGHTGLLSPASLKCQRKTDQSECGSLLGEEEVVVWGGGVVV